MTQYDPNERRQFNPLIQSVGAGISSLGGFGLAGGQGEPWRGGQWPYQQPPMPRPRQILQQDPWGIKPMGEQITGFGETLGGYGEQLGGFEETLGGLGEQMGGYGERLGGFESTLGGLGEQMGGFGEQFGNISDRLGKIEEGIAGLNKSSPMQQQPPRSFYGGFNPYSMFGGLSSLFGGYGRGRGRYG